MWNLGRDDGHMNNTKTPKPIVTENADGLLTVTLDQPDYDLAMQVISDALPEDEFIVCVTLLKQAEGSYTYVEAEPSW